MKVLGIIPARYESSRFPGKPLIDLKGKTMIRRVYERASECSLISKVIVATDDQRIFDEVKSFGGEVMMTADTHRNGTERCGEVVNVLKEFEVVINIQGDEPLIHPKQLERIISVFDQNEVKIATIARKIDNIEAIRNPNRVKVAMDKNQDALYFSRSPIPHVAQKPHEDWLASTLFYKHIGLYAWRRETLNELLKLSPTELEKSESLEQLRWLENGYKIRCIISDLDTPNIDVPEDVKKVLDLL
ncbi:MAG: 3-deoxy-manno-octulosonate cytidylyltransferase [Crocinitomicaceae bacterium]|nr:3-deoxy-manno-octulosonate cytidylyltransferase [Crocinitomicaceae bacterium]